MRGEYRDAVINMLGKYPKAICCFNGNKGGISVSVTKYNSDSELRDELYELISTDMDLGFGLEHWVMFVQKGVTENEDVLIVKPVCVL